MKPDWLLAPIVLLASFLAGLASSRKFYTHHDSNDLDPFYIRAWSGLIGGLVALPICLLFRPSATYLAFIVLSCGAGTVLAFHAYRRFSLTKQIDLRESEGRSR